MIPDEHRQFVDDMMARYGVPPLPQAESLPRDVGSAVVVAQGRAAADGRDVRAQDPAHRERARSRPRLHGRARARERRRRRRARRQEAARRAPDATRASTSSSLRATRPAATPARSARWCLIPEVVDAVAPTPGARRRRHRQRPPGRGVARARRAGRVVRIGVAHDRGGGDAPDREGEVPRGNVVRHGSLAAPRRASRPGSCVRRGPRSGTTPTTPTRCRCRCTAC